MKKVFLVLALIGIGFCCFSQDFKVLENYVFGKSTDSVSYEPQILQCIIG
jgi:hypothetical protein